LLNQELSGKIGDLENLEQQLGVLKWNCDGNVIQATQLIERLERNTKLNTSNSIHLFFSYADKNKNGRIDVDEVDAFVDSIRCFKDHFPAFESEKVRRNLTEQGGMSEDHIRGFVETMMPDGGSRGSNADICSVSTTT